MKEILQSEIVQYTCNQCEKTFKRDPDVVLTVKDNLGYLEDYHFCSTNCAETFIRKGFLTKEVACDNCAFYDKVLYPGTLKQNHLIKNKCRFGLSNLNSKCTKFACKKWWKKLIGSF